MAIEGSIEFLQPGKPSSASSRIRGEALKTVSCGTRIITENLAILISGRFSTRIRIQKSNDQAAGSSRMDTSNSGDYSVTTGSNCLSVPGCEKSHVGGKSPPPSYDSSVKRPSKIEQMDTDHVKPKKALVPYGTAVDDETTRTSQTIKDLHDECMRLKTSLYDSVKEVNVFVRFFPKIRIF